MSNKYLSPKLIKFIAVSAVCFGLVFLNPKGIFNPVRLVFLEIAYPFQKTSYILGQGIDEFFSFLNSIGLMRTENKKLIRENDLLTAEVVSLHEMKKENESLREQFDLAPRNKFDLEPSFVIGQDSQNLGSWLIVDKGSADGIKSGMAVIVSEGILIGRVEEVYPDSARVILLTDSSSVINASDLETGAKGLLRGTYGLGMIFDMVTQSDVLSEGDTIITSGLGGEVPKGLLIGKIQEIKMSTDKLFQQAIIIPRVKYRKLDVVFVVKK
ncbi:MAG: Cell shape-determining protein MreC [Candidatus Moranbacteria bacterium GW2011_GWA2_39_41]|nr:MAG: Cell shape-determining protein MreC [Candidatus Moranbacteria bacterium GW2011_GWA2_39_41]